MANEQNLRANAGLKPIHDYEWRFGGLGFLNDFDVRNPPPKGERELRIILIGGSGALGEGARTNEDMLYRKLEQRFADIFKDHGFHGPVGNLGAGGSGPYQ